MTYVYACCRCWDTFEASRTVAERDAPIDCPVCGTAAVREFAPCVIHMPLDKCWASETREILAPPRSNNVVVTKGMGKALR